MNAVWRLGSSVGVFFCYSREISSYFLSNWFPTLEIVCVTISTSPRAHSCTYTTKVNEALSCMSGAKNFYAEILRREGLRDPVRMNYEVTSRSRIRILKEASNMDILRSCWSVVGKPWQAPASSAHCCWAAASGGNVSNRTLNCSCVADLMSVHGVVVSEVRVSKEAGSCVLVVGEVVGGETKSRVIHVVVVNLLRVHGSHQVRHLECQMLGKAGKKTEFLGENLRLQTITTRKKVRGNTRKNRRKATFNLF